MPDMTSIAMQPGDDEPVTILDSLQIQAIIPHREPFLLVDRIVELEEGKRIVGMRYVNPNEAYLRGHFPNYPVMPGVLVVEALAQTGAVLVMRNPTNAGKIPFFARIDNCRFREQVRPGDTLRLEVEATTSRGPVGKAHARALVGGKVVAEADLTFAFGDAPAAG
jgi:3-hydroxyacyl-[acyl-carrier-protein] dehydratase